MGFAMTFFGRGSAGLQEKRQVLREKDALVQDDLATGDAPAAVHPAQEILPLADQQIGLRLDAVPVDQEAALDRDLARRWG
jgi:hypothetical protein